jgi:hypothetical protein
MKAEKIDLALRLEEMAIQLIRAPSPQPLGAFDAVDLRSAAKELRRLRVEVAKGPKEEDQP